ncbi:hypothetical protein [Propioniciclava tarda]|uniref:Uncharacterized protein n=1 Tax=Propioniciclava tarda TaxID=433330 RepID=A0A4Q9KK87_PROTD|nr:hypothetical protein [Propioniciclava tarda]TBT94863.1 hypothetical protein ET996_08780 [Propioniciclava tarda]SMO63806.1 hypothetical protein SAMN06266982_10991 [Propioniciclava tarda]
MSTPPYQPPDSAAPSKPDASGGDAPTTSEPAAAPASGVPSYGPPSHAGASGSTVPSYGPPVPGSPADSPTSKGYAPPAAEPPVQQAVAPGYTPPSVGEAQSTPTHPTAGYTPPSVGGGAHSTPAQPVTGYTPPSMGGHAPAPAQGYQPPAQGGVPSAPPATTSPQAPIAFPPLSHSENTQPPVAEPPTPDGPSTARPGMNPLVLIGAALLVLVIVGFAIAWLLGAFSPKMSHLPARVGSYALDSSTQKSSATIYDSGTYRAGSGDLYTASIVKDAPDPAAAFNKAAADTRLQQGDVYCVGVSKTGKGATCTILLPTGSAVKVEASTRHTAQETAQFTQDLRDGIK